MDIRHCMVPRLPGVVAIHEGKEDKNVVIIAKHLCGLASDLAIRSLHAYRNTSLDAIDSKCGKSDINKKANGVTIATCCHHACSWNDYTGKEWILSLGS